MAAAVGLSALGMAYHTVREFGYAGLLSPATGMIPVVGLQIFLFLVWWLAPGSRLVAGRALLVTGMFQLVGGAIISVLPLPFLPFQPEQSVSHYLSHLFLGLAQIPLIVVPLLQERHRARQPQAGG
jgi:hypothetical protein